MIYYIKTSFHTVLNFWEPVLHGKFSTCVTVTMQSSLCILLQEKKVNLSKVKSFLTLHKTLVALVAFS